MAPAYRFGKGEIVKLLEEFVENASVDTMNRWLKELRAQAKNPTDDDTQLDTYVGKKNPDEYIHLVHDVFGFDRPGQDPKPAADKDEGRSRRMVYAKGFALAVEASYGIPAGQTIPDSPPRHWKLDVYWGCGQPSNSVIVTPNIDAELIVVHVFSTAIPPGVDLKVMSKTLPKKSTLVDDHLGPGEKLSVVRT